MGLQFGITWQFATQYGNKSIRVLFFDGFQIVQNEIMWPFFLQQVSTPSFQYPSLSQGQLNESQMDSRSLRLDRIQQALAMTSDEMRR